MFRAEVGSVIYLWEDTMARDFLVLDISIELLAMDLIQMGLGLFICKLYTALILQNL